MKNGVCQSLTGVFVLAVSLSYQAVGAIAEDKVLSLDGEIRDGANTHFSVRSTSIKKERSTEVIVIDIARNHIFKEECPYRWFATGINVFEGVVPHGASMTQKWNTFRGITSTTGQIDSKVIGTFPATRWVAKNLEPKDATTVGSLYGILIDGEEGKGKVLFECMSTLTRKAETTFIYEYKATNRSGKILKLDWAGFRKDVEPGKSVSESIEADYRTKETTGLAELKMDKGNEYTITAHYWKKPPPTTTPK